MAKKNKTAQSKPFRMADTECTEFIPTPERWAEFYGKWSSHMVRSLWSHGSKADCEEAVQVAFLKVVGLSENLKLRKELEPRTEKEWYAFVLWQARGVLSHMHQRAARFESFNPDRHRGGLSVHRRDCEHLRRVLDAAIWEACRGLRNPVAKYKAFVMFTLDEAPAEKVVEAIPEVFNANNLYQICARVRRALAAAARRPGSTLAQLRCA